MNTIAEYNINNCDKPKDIPLYGNSSKSDTQELSYRSGNSYIKNLLADYSKIDSRKFDMIVKATSKSVAQDISEVIEKELFKTYLLPKQDSKVKKIKPYSFIGYLIKRAIDIIGTMVLSILAFPIVIYAIYRIKKESPGSIIFRQTRVGKDGKKFTCYKFRSMHENSYHNPYTEKEDNRIFSWGRFMRRSRIDELPQLINVLKGDMHIVGPRAEWDILSKEYEAKIPYYKMRYLVKPGITGWAQVNYPYGVCKDDAQEKLAFDLYYIKHWTPWLELKTILKTILVVLGKKGQ